MKLYQEKKQATNVPTKPPCFSCEEMNVLRRESEKRYRQDSEQLSRHFKFLMEFEQGDLLWSNMTDSQKRYLWAIKATMRGLVK